MNIEELSVGEEACYSAEFTPQETGYYTIYAYLYHEGRRIGCKTESIYAQKKAAINQVDLEISNRFFD